MAESEIDEVSKTIKLMEAKGLAEEWREIDSEIETVKLRLDYLLDKVQKRKVQFAREMSKKLTLSRFKGYNEVQLHEFLDSPYAILPRGPDKPNEWWVVTPKFTNYELGYLDHSANGWHYFLVNKYMMWLARIPEEIKSKFKFRKPIPLRVYDGMLLTGEDAQEDAWNRYRKHLTQRKGKDQIRVKMGHEFNLIAEIIDDGMLPFTPQPVEEEDMKIAQTDFTLREYQQEWFEEFLKWGAVGVFAPFGAGKTFIGLHAIASLKGRKLVVAPTRGLTDQWEERLNRFVKTPEDVDIVTYHSYKKIRDKEYVIAIYDECLPYYAKVTLADGSQRNIGELVDEKSTVNVLSYNKKTGLVEAKPIVSHFKIPLSRPLVRVVHEYGEMICTVDHKIWTDKGYVEASLLSNKTQLFCREPLPNDYMPRMRERTIEPIISVSASQDNTPDRTISNRLSVQRMWGNISNIPSIERSSRNSPPSRSSKKKSPEATKKSLRDVSKEVFSSSRGQFNQTNRQTKKFDIRGVIRRYFNPKTKDNNKCSITDPTQFKASRVCYVEIFSPEKSRRYTSQNFTEWRLGSTNNDLLNLESSLSDRNLRDGGKKREKDYYDEMASENRSPWISSLVYGRWNPWEAKPPNPSIYAGLYGKGELSSSRMVNRRLDDTYNSGLLEGILSTTKEETNTEILGFGSSPHNPLNEVQNWVYDLEIGDNHNFFVDDVLMSNCHRLPANQFAKMSTVRAKYRMGLSGTPYREDGRTNYIFALTGHPLALSWDKFFDLNIVNMPTITLYLFTHYRYKDRKLDQLLQQEKKTIIFVWRINVGKALQKKYGIPFVYGATPGPDRLEIIRNSQQVIVSSVGSEGISIPDLERVIEYDWLGKSRREEAQRMGRLFHSEEKDPEHIVLMTDAEFEKDETRLYSAYEKGFRINVIR